MQDLDDLGLKEAEGSSAIFSENLNVESWEGQERERQSEQSREDTGGGMGRASSPEEEPVPRRTKAERGLTILHSGVIAGELHPVAIPVLHPSLQRASLPRTLPCSQVSGETQFFLPALSPAPPGVSSPSAHWQTSPEHKVDRSLLLVGAA